MRRRLRHLADEALAALYILVVLIGWPVVLLMLARKVGLGGLALGMVLLATYILLVIRGGRDEQE